MNKILPEAGYLQGYPHTIVGDVSPIDFESSGKDFIAAIGGVILVGVTAHAISVRIGGDSRVAAVYRSSDYV